MSQRTALAISAVFVVLVSVPILLMLFGQRAALDQNRVAAAVDGPTLDSVGDASWFSTLDAAFEDRLPLRPEAVTADAWIDVEILGDSPSSKVVSGTSGWLFLSETIAQPCPSPADMQAMSDEMAEAHRIAAAADVRLIFSFAPDKVSVYSERVPQDVSCALAVAAMLESLEGHGVVSVLSEMIEAKDREQTYFRLDTHWNRFGASIMAAELIEAIGTVAWLDSAVKNAGSKELEGDLTRYQGLPRVEETVLYRTERTDVTSTVSESEIFMRSGELVEGLKIRRHTSTGPNLIPGNTVVMHDSFGWAVVPTLAPYFESISFVRRRDPSLDYLFSLVQESDILILEILQRSALNLVMHDSISSRFAAALADAATVVQPRAVLGPEEVTVTADPDSYVFFEALDTLDSRCAIRVAPEHEIVLSQGHHRGAVRVDAVETIQNQCPGVVRYWVGTFGEEVGQ